MYGPGRQRIGLVEALQPVDLELGVELHVGARDRLAERPVEQRLGVLARCRRRRRTPERQRAPASTVSRQDGGAGVEVLSGWSGLIAKAEGQSAARRSCRPDATSERLAALGHQMCPANRAAARRSRRAACVAVPAARRRGARVDGRSERVTTRLCPPAPAELGRIGGTQPGQRARRQKRKGPDTRGRRPWPRRCGRRRAQRGISRKALAPLPQVPLRGRAGRASASGRRGARARQRDRTLDAIALRRR